MTDLVLWTHFAHFWVKSWHSQWLTERVTLLFQSHEILSMVYVWQSESVMNSFCLGQICGLELANLVTAYALAWQYGTVCSFQLYCIIVSMCISFMLCMKLLCSIISPTCLLTAVIYTWCARCRQQFERGEFIFSSSWCRCTLHHFPLWQAILLWSLNLKFNCEANMFLIVIKHIARIDVELHS